MTQGWLSLSDCGPGQGTLQVVPLLKESTAFFLLRPFLEDIAAAEFCGAAPAYQQNITAEHHQQLRDLVVSIPRVTPGDTVFWHCDLIHSVEAKHTGTEDASVFYIPAAPVCPKNTHYLQRQAECFLEGLTPPDFPANNSEKSAVGRAGLSTLSSLGRKQMGLEHAL